MVLLLTGKFQNDRISQTRENWKTSFWDRIGPDFRPAILGWSSVHRSKPLKLRYIRTFLTIGKSKRISISFTTYRDMGHRKTVLFSQIWHFSVHNSGTRFFLASKLGTHLKDHKGPFQSKNQQNLMTAFRENSKRPLFWPLLTPYLDPKIFFGKITIKGFLAL